MMSVQVGRPKALLVGMRWVSLLSGFPTVASGHTWTWKDVEALCEITEHLFSICPAIFFNSRLQILRIERLTWLLILLPATIFFPWLHQEKSLFPNQGLNLHSLQRKHRVLTTGTPRKSLSNCSSDFSPGKFYLPPFSYFS